MRAQMVMYLKKGNHAWSSGQGTSEFLSVIIAASLILTPI